jgi:hypothetical protein
MFGLLSDVHVAIGASTCKLRGLAWFLEQFNNAGFYIASYLADFL